MSRLFYHTMQDNAGNLLFGVTGTMRIAGTGTLATLYGDEALTVPIPNPMTNHATFGSFKCYLAPAVYDFYMAKAGYTFETLTGIPGLGSMATQNAGTVAITGGTITGVTVPEQVGNNITGLYSALQAAGGTARYFIVTDGNAPSILRGNVQIGNQPALSADVANGRVGIGTFAPITAARLRIHHPRATDAGLWIQATDSDVGGNNTVQFANVAGTGVGSITCTAAATAYNTVSDARLKHAIAPLTGALDVVRALKPSRFRWKADDSAGVGFLAGEVQEVIPDGVITGERGAIDSEGNILPQQIDLSKLVPWLVGALQTLAGQVELLTERVAELETGLGV